MKNYEVHKIGHNKGAPRVWIQGRKAQSAGFVPGAPYQVEVRHEQQTVILKLDESGSRNVTGKDVKGTTVPVIDINAKGTLAPFEGMEEVRIVTRAGAIYILPLARERRKAERIERAKERLRSNQPLTVGSLSHGGGVLSLALHTGMKAAGVGTRLSFANDIRPEMLEQASRANPAWDSQTVALAAPMQELVFDEWAMSQLNQVDILEAGIPCVGASLSGRAKNGTSCAEAHPEAGHLVVAFLAAIAKVNPLVVVLENVVPYANTASMHVIRNQLRDLGYDVHETVLKGEDFNVLEHRERMCMVAVTQGVSFEWDGLETPEREVRQLGDVLDDVPLDAACWSEMDYLRKKEERDKSAGKGFAMQIVTPLSEKVGTIGAIRRIEVRSPSSSIRRTPTCCVCSPHGSTLK